MRINKYRQLNQNLSRGEVFTPPQLVIKILSKISETIYLNKESTFLVPGCGMGVFMIELVRILVEKYGYSIEDAKSRVIGVDNRIKYINFLKRKGYRVYHLDFLKDELPMLQFDAIIGNPPYQKSDNKRWKLWVSFISKSLPLLKENAYLSFITPIAWIEGMGSELQTARNLLYSKNVTYVNVNIDDYFPSVNERIGYFILKNTEYTGSTLIENLSSLHQMNLTEYSTNPLQKSISSKVFSFTEKIEHKNFLSYKTKDIAENKCSETKTDIFSVKVIHSGSQILYYKEEFIPTKYFGKKIIINMSGHYFMEDKNYIYYTDTDIPGRNTTAVYVDDTNKDNIEFILKSKLYRYIIYSNKSSGFNSGPFQQLPKFTESLISCKTNEDIYAYFGLTYDEQNEIENYVG